MKRFALSLAAALILGLPPGTATATEDHKDTPPEETTPTILITEIQTRTDDNTSEEFIELYNSGEESVSLDGWRIDFLNAEHDGKAEPTRNVVSFPDIPKQNTEDDKENDLENAPHEVPSDSSFVIGREDYFEQIDYHIDSRPSAGHLNTSSGTVLLIDTNDTIVDMVGYGSANNYLGEPAPAPPQGESITRCFDEDDKLTNSGDNAADFIINENPLPGDGLDCPEPEPVNECTDLRITEIGANLSDGEQFIEIHNPTDEVIELWGCTLQTNRNDNTYVFSDDDILEPDEYHAVLVSDTDLTLTKTTSGTVYILSSDHTIEVDEQYYEDLRADTSWAWFGEDDWRRTYDPTPGKPNSWQEFLPCPEGQERNPDTGRCRNVAAASTELPDCGPGRERNPETNRCRNIDTGPELKPCGPGRERNPETNRCRNIASTTSSLQPCGPNQERNPETNRCRNIVSSNVAAMPDVHDIQAVTEGSPYRWWVAGAAVATVAAYAIFEWRRDIAALLAKLKQKATR